MTGLILKDLLNLKKQMGIFALLLVFYMVLAFTSGESAMLGGMVAVVCIMLPITAMAYDERAGWDKLALSMPVSRREMVLSKYALGIVTSAIGMAVMTGFQLLLKENMAEGLVVSAILFGGGLVMLSVLIPLMLKFGTEKARLLMMAVVLVPVIGMISLWKLDVTLPPMEWLLTLAPIVLPLGIAIILGLSIALSLHIYKRKEL